MKKVGWLILSCVTVLALVLASCAQAPTEEATTTAPTTVAKTTVAPTTVAPTTVVPTTAAAAEEPQYGGIFTFVNDSATLGFDDAKSGTTPNTTYLTNERMLFAKRQNGPGGTGKYDYQYTFLPMPYEDYDGELAENFELQPGKGILHIRHGVHWQSKAPANGREFTADDVVAAMTRSVLKSDGRLYSYYPPGIGPTNITALDKWTVEIDLPVTTTGLVFQDLCYWCTMHCPEIWKQYGDCQKWENALGTGPFILTDFVPQSSATFVRNPNYWRYDVFYPENQLPYVDGVKMLEISDASTKLAALRTGKVDHLRQVLWEDANNLLKTNPELKYYKGVSRDTLWLCWRLDKPELPFKDIRVRQALSMAVDRQSMVTDLYGGNANWFPWPVHPSPYFDSMRILFDELPQDIQDIYTYNPEKARELLEDAGYPDGFTFKVDVQQQYADLLSVLKAYFADIGVTMEITVRESAAFSSMNTNRTYEQAVLFSRTCVLPWEMGEFKVGDSRNKSYVDDPYLTEEYGKIQPNYFFDMPKVFETYKNDVITYVLEKTYYIHTPITMVYTLWQPWLKGYYGEYTVGLFNQWNYSGWIWIDQNLKKAMGR